MSETAATRLGGAGVLTPAGIKGKPAQSDKRETEAAVDPAMPQALADPHLAETVEPPLQGEEAAPEGAGANAAPPRGSEIELKLLVDADDLADFNKAPVIASHARNNGDAFSVFGNTRPLDPVKTGWPSSSAHFMVADGGNSCSMGRRASLAAR